MDRNRKAREAIWGLDTDVTVAEQLGFRTTLDADRQKYYDNMSEVCLARYCRFAKNGECEKIVARFILNLYKKKFQDKPYIELNR